MNYRDRILFNVWWFKVEAWVLPFKFQVKDVYDWILLKFEDLEKSKLKGHLKTLKLPHYE